VPEWISQGAELTVRYTSRAERDLRKLADCDEVRRQLSATLRADPRSRYRREKCGDRLYYVNVLNAHCTVWFDKDEGEDEREEVAEVLRIKKVEEEDGKMQE